MPKRSIATIKHISHTGHDVPLLAAHSGSPPPLMHCPLPPPPSAVPHICGACSADDRGAKAAPDFANGHASVFAGAAEEMPFKRATRSAVRCRSEFMLNESSSILCKVTCHFFFCGERRLRTLTSFFRMGANLSTVEVNVCADGNGYCIPGQEGKRWTSLEDANEAVRVFTTTKNDAERNAFQKAADAAQRAREDAADALKRARVAAADTKLRRDDASVVAGSSSGITAAVVVTLFALAIFGVVLAFRGGDVRPAVTCSDETQGEESSGARPCSYGSVCVEGSCVFGDCTDASFACASACHACVNNQCTYACASGFFCDDACNTCIECDASRACATPGHVCVDEACAACASRESGLYSDYCLTYMCSTCACCDESGDHYCVANHLDGEAPCDLTTGKALGAFEFSALSTCAENEYACALGDPSMNVSEQSFCNSCCTTSDCSGDLQCSGDPENTFGAPWACLRAQSEATCMTADAARALRESGGGDDDAACKWAY